MKFDMLVVLGPTASGKTRLGVQLARHLSGEIVSADSRQVYRGMDIGTGKDLHEYGEIPRHLIDIIMPGCDFNLFQYQRRFLDAYDAIRSHGRLPILVGGTGMYLEAVLNGYRLAEVPENPLLREELAGYTMEALIERLKSIAPRLHNTSDLLDRQRLVRATEIAMFQDSHEPESLPAIRSLVLGVRWERSMLRQRITLRLKERLEQGLVEEVAALHASGLPWEKLEFYGLEYRFAARHLQGQLTRNDMFQKLNAAIHDFAKRQETWFRRMERNGTAINWVEGAGDPLAEALQIVATEGR